jgi:hypothetical protein
MKQQHQLIGIAIVLPALMFSIEACNRQESQVPETAVTTPVQPRMEPMTVAGCLRAGAADRTFVLTEERSTDPGGAVTYHLIGHEGIDLATHVGEQVEVSGTLRAEQQMASTGESVDKDRAKGTSGTPTIETKSEIGIGQFDVSAVKSLGARCGR